MRLTVILVAVALTAFGQRHKLGDVDTEKPEGKMLQQIGQENDPAKKAALLEQFTQQFPKAEAGGWVLEQLQGLYVKANDPDKVIATGDKLLAVDPDDPEAALQCLKAAEAKKDIPLILKYSAMASAFARKLAATPKPADAEQAESWKTDVDYAKQVDTYTEYALYAAAVTSRDPKTIIQLGEELEKRGSNGEYTMKMRQPLFLAYRQAGENEKAVGIAEKVLATDQSNEDMLLAAADSYLQSKKDPEKVHAYSAKVVEVMAAKPKPEGMTDADWNNRKTMIVGLAHYMNGKQYYSESKFSQADQELRAALPAAQANAAMKGETLFSLGFANYKLDKIQEAVNYYRECAAIKSQFQPTCAKNIEGIRRQYTGVK